MLLTALSIALVANDYRAPVVAYPQNERIVTASVHILAAEIIDFDESSRDSKGVARQHRTRDGMPMVEFY